MTVPGYHDMLGLACSYRMQTNGESGRFEKIFGVIFCVMSKYDTIIPIIALTNSSLLLEQIQNTESQPVLHCLLCYKLWKSISCFI